MEIVYDSPLGKRLRELRKRSGLSVREMAQRLGKSPGYISRIEVRGDVPSAELICELAAIHGESAGSLLSLAKEAQLERLNVELDVKYESVLAAFEGDRQGRRGGLGSCR